MHNALHDLYYFIWIANCDMDVTARPRLSPWQEEKRQRLQGGHGRIDLRLFFLVSSSGAYDNAILVLTFFF
jgi:hypothetical protein